MFVLPKIKDFFLSNLSQWAHASFSFLTPVNKCLTRRARLNRFCRMMSADLNFEPSFYKAVIISSVVQGLQSTVWLLQPHVLNWRWCDRVVRTCVIWECENNKKPLSGTCWPSHCLCWPSASAAPIKTPADTVEAALRSFKHPSLQKTFTVCRVSLDVDMNEKQKTDPSKKEVGFTDSTISILLCHCHWYS